MSNMRTKSKFFLSYLFIIILDQLQNYIHNPGLLNEKKEEER